MIVRRQNSLGVLLRLTAFRRMWLALSVSSLGDWLGLLATTALAAYLTRESSNLVQGAAVSGVLLTRLLPDLILGPIAGALVDRLDRRKVAIIGDSMAGLLYLSIAIVGNLTWLLAAQFLVEAVGLFSNPAKQALWVNIVPRERLAVANQLNYVSVYGMVPVAAVLFALLATLAQFFGAPTVPNESATSALISGTSALAITIALVFDAASYFLAAGVLFVTRRLIPAYLDERPSAKSVFSLIREGIGFVKNSRVMRAIYVGILGAFGAGGLVAGVAQAYVATMGAGNAGYGILFGTVFSGIALGMLIGPKVLPAVPRRMVFTLGIGVAGCALIVMSLLQDFVGAAVTSVVMGLFAGIAWITGFTMIGHEVSDRLRGRVFAFVMSSVRITLLGTIAVGPILANTIGFHPLRVGEYRLELSGPAIVLAGSGLLTVGVALFAGRQVGGLRAEAVRRVLRRIVGSPRREFLDAEESLPGALITVVGADRAATEQYARAVSDHLTAGGWRVQRDDAGLAPPRADDNRSTALRAMADLSELVTRRLRPALEAGTVVVCRDYVDAAVVRFGALAGLTEEYMLRMAAWATGGLRPDLTVLVDPLKEAPSGALPAAAGDADGVVAGGVGDDGAAAAGPVGAEVAQDAAAGVAGGGGVGGISRDVAGAADPVDVEVAQDAETVAGGGGVGGISRDVAGAADPVDVEVAQDAETVAGGGGVGPAEGVGAADGDAADHGSAGAESGLPEAVDVPDGSDAVDPRRVYQDLAAAVPDRYAAVLPLRPGQGIPPEVAEWVASVLRKRSPSRRDGEPAPVVGINEADLLRHGAGGDGTGGGGAPAGREAEDPPTGDGPPDSPQGRTGKRRRFADRTA